MSSPRPEPTPASRKRAQTVKRLLEAANAVIAEKGFQRASLDEIAARAGLTKGAVYSNFDSKDHLFWAVLGSRRLTIPSEWRGDRSMRENLRLTAEAFCDAGVDDDDRGVGHADDGFIEDWAFVVARHTAIDGAVDPMQNDPTAGGLG